ncbi:MAG: ankyrin repeat domain-containing protein [Pseudomonadota bacterium]
MNNIKRPEFSNPLDVLKIWISGFGIKVTNQQEKELNNTFLAYNRYHFIVDELVINNLRGAVSDGYLKALQNAMESAVNYRLEDAGSVVFERLTCFEAEQLIVEELLPSIFAEFLVHIQSSQTELISPLTLLAGDNEHLSVARTVQALRKDKHWPVFYESLSKEDKDKLVRWEKTELPSLSKVCEIFENDNLSSDTRVFYKTAVLHARLLDALKTKPQYKKLLAATRLKLFNQDIQPIVDVWRNHFTKGRENYHREVQSIINHFSSGRNLLHDNAYLKDLERLRGKLLDDERGWSYVFHCDWLKARYLTVNGDLKGACHCYVKTLDSVAFLIGPLHADLLSDSLMAASMCGATGNSVLLKKAKNLAILLNVGICHDHPDEWQRRALTKVSDFIKPYEIKRLQKLLKGEFPNAQIDWEVHPDPFVVVSDIDYADPNRRSRLGDSDIRIEQICRAVMMREYDAISSFLDDADLSRSRNLNRGHNSLFIALQNYEDSLENQDRDVVLKLLAKLKKEKVKYQKRVVELLGTRSDEHKLTCLALAINAGDKEVVAELLELGAPASQRHSKQFVTPLVTALRRLSDVVRGGSERGERERSARDIALMLLEKGASPNAKHDEPGPGYTALALAAEMNEVDLFEKMIADGGDVNATYLDPVEQREIGLKTVARYFKSHEILELLHKFKIETHI